MKYSIIAIQKSTSAIFAFRIQFICMLTKALNNKGFYQQSHVTVHLTADRGTAKLLMFQQHTSLYRTLLHKDLSGVVTLLDLTFIRIHY